MIRPTNKFLDAIGRDLVKGNNVYFPDEAKSTMIIGIVTGFGAKKSNPENTLVKVQTPDGNQYVEPYKCIIIDTIYSNDRPESDMVIDVPIFRQKVINPPNKVTEDMVEAISILN